MPTQYEPDYYTVLGVNHKATAQEIVQAYRARARLLHPDVFPDASAASREEANRMMSELNRAFEVLRDADSRARYDSSRGIGREYEKRHASSSAGHSSASPNFRPPPKWTLVALAASNGFREQTRNPIFLKGMIWVAAGIATLCLIVVALTRKQTAEWKPTGDGRTIVNSRTGEIRVSATGESIEAYQARTSQAAADAESQMQENLAASRAEAQQRRLLLEEERKRQDAQTFREAAEKALQNGVHYNAVQVIAFDTIESEFSSGGYWLTWSRLTSPFRNDTLPPMSQRDSLVSFVGDAIHDGAIRGPKWPLLVEHLNSLAYGDSGYGHIVLTSEQISSASDARERGLMRADAESKAKQAKNRIAILANKDMQIRARAKWQRLQRGLSQVEVGRLLGDATRESATEWRYFYDIMIVPSDASYVVSLDGIIRFDTDGNVRDWEQPQWSIDNL